MTAPMAREQNTGSCELCGKTFQYYLVHNGFNDSAYSYCDKCGCTVLLNRFSRVPVPPTLKVHQRLWDGELERLLKPCRCGGTFRADANPRCPHCEQPLSAIQAKGYIEANAPGAKKGWKWQNNWTGLYAIVVDNNVVHDWWNTSEGATKSK